MSGTSSSCYRFRENVLRRNTFFTSMVCFFPRGRSGPLDLWQFGGTLKKFENCALTQSFLAVRLSLTQRPAAKSASFWAAVVAKLAPLSQKQNRQGAVGWNPSSIAAHPFGPLRAGSCKKRKGGPPSVGMV